MSSGETNRIHNGRDHLPGISRRFNPQEAITAYKEMVNAENEYYRSDRSKIKKGEEVTPCIKHASYVTIGHNSSSTVGSSLSSKPRSKSHGPISATLNFSDASVRNPLIGAKRDWEEKYRYFSRPFNLSDHACSAFESVRMRESFDRHCSSESPTESEASSCDKVEISTNAHKKLIASGMRDCGELVELSRSTAKLRGSSTAHAGYDWPRYKYFSSGMNNPSSGTMDKLLLTDARFAVAR